LFACDPVEETGWMFRFIDYAIFFISYDIFYYLIFKKISKGDHKYKEAIELSIKLADQGNADAQYQLGSMYSLGFVVPNNNKKAIEWWIKAADQGHADAQYKLGSMYDKGRVVPKDYEKAFEWYTKAAKQGNTAAQEELDRIYAYSEVYSKFIKSLNNG